MKHQDKSIKVTLENKEHMTVQKLKSQFHLDSSYETILFWRAAYAPLALA